MSGTDLCQLASSCPETAESGQKARSIKFVRLIKQLLTKELASAIPKSGHELASSCPDAAPPETDSFDQKSPFIRIIWLMK